MTRRGWIALAATGTLAFILAIALVIVIAVDDGDPAPATAQEPTLESSPGMAGPMGGGMPPEVEECLSEQGVDPPGAGGVPDEAEIERFQEAIEECGLPAPQIVTPGH